MGKLFFLLPFFALFALLAFSGCVSNNSTGLAAANNAPSGSQISVPLEEVSAKAKWFEYKSGNTVIRFFAVKAGDGSVKTAFDACDVCYSKKKGYRQEGSEMVCNNCGRRFPVNGLGTENRNPGGCWPSYLPNRVVGNNVVISKADLDKGRWRFA